MKFRIINLGKFWGNIITGIGVLIPFLVTIFVVSKLFSIADSILPGIVHTFIKYIPENWGTGIGFLFTLIIAYFTGLATKNWIGERIIKAGNDIISTIPLVNKIYFGIQQIVETVSRDKKSVFEKAVLVEYPKAGSYCVGFVTSETTGEIKDKVGKELYSIFVPTTPNPTSGFLLFVAKEDVIHLNISVEVAVKLVVSAGILNAEDIKKTTSLYAVSKKNPLEWMRKKKKEKYDADPRD